jgi:acyl-CoA thioester hydrolase
VTERVDFEFSVQVRYMEVDAQGVVFNGWYLTYFDEAFTAFLAAGGLPYTAMLDAGFDVQLVRTEIDWLAPLRHQDDVRVAVALASVGTTSLTVDFVVRTAGSITCRARTVYVVIAVDGRGKLPVPDVLRQAAGATSP